MIFLTGVFQVYMVLMCCSVATSNATLTPWSIVSAMVDMTFKNLYDIRSEPFLLTTSIGCLNAIDMALNHDSAFLLDLLQLVMVKL